jgi:carbonic anhydrase/acetyltransferase-like protein (isoleucine patch superfamily)
LTGNLGESKCEGFAEVPFTLLDALGRPALYHVVDGLHRAGLYNRDICVLSNLRSPAAAYSQRIVERMGLSWTNFSGASLVRAAEGKFAEYAHAGAEVILVIQAGAYAEIDYEGLIQFHLESQNRVTCVSDDDGLVGTFAISASRRNDAAYLFRHNLQACRTTSVPYSTRGYVNRLQNAADFRQLVVDAFAEQNSIRPSGRQLRPGVWVGAGACIEREARIVAPAYIGEGAKVCRSAVVTRCSNIERNALVDCGTVVENATVLPSSYVGAGLDVSHAVVGFRRIAHLNRKIEIEIHDRRLLAPVPKAAMWRVAGMASAAMEFLQRGWAPGRSPAPAPELPPEIAIEPEPAEISTESELQQIAADPNIAVLRRYGNQ